MSTLKRYIQAICKGPCLAKTVHENVLEGHNSMGNNPLPIWEQLKEEMGEEEARKAVEEWIRKPYKLD